MSVPYHDFRCSVSFTEARLMVVAESVARYAREGQCIRPTRKRILGKLREIKFAEYEHYRRSLEGESSTDTTEARKVG